LEGGYESIAKVSGGARGRKKWEGVPETTKKMRSFQREVSKHGEEKVDERNVDTQKQTTEKAEAGTSPKPWVSYLQRDAWGQARGGNQA